ncbi:hypothetical protein EJB05_45997, partial [Eragrostis curvula]
MSRRLSCPTHLQETCLLLLIDSSNLEEQCAAAGCASLRAHKEGNSKQTAVLRASNDFFPRNPVSHTIHIAAVAYNSVFLGEFMLPDWGMFHSLHPAGEYHGSDRAISGGPIYVSDAPGKHDFELLKKIVLPDGSVLRPRLPGRPTKDCLFTDPARDGGAAWSFVEKKTMFHQTGTEALTYGVKGSNVHLISEAATDPEWNGDCVVYCHASGDIVVLPNGAALPVSLKVLEQDILTVSLIKDLAPGFRFAPIGLIDMFNGGAAVEGLTYHLLDGAKMLGGDYSASSSEAVGLVCMEVRGCGRFGAYSSVRPRKCMLGSTQVEFSYESSSGLAILQLKDMPKERVHRIVFEL